MTHRSRARLLADASCDGPVPNVRRWGAALAGAAICLAAALPAVAHTELIGSSPADGATLTTPPAEVLLEFSEPVQTEFGQVAVLDDADVHHEQGNPQIVGATVTQGVDELPAGTYRISYRVGSADGHPITGTLAFTVTAETTPPEAPPTTPTPVATSVDPHEGMNHADHPSETATPVAESAAGGGDALLYAGGGVAVAAVLGAVLYVALDRRRPRDEPTAEEAGPGQ
ncbi:MAG: copper resistance CopC family protein [Jiangellaceae bacterium]